MDSVSPFSGSANAVLIKSIQYIIPHVKYYTASCDVFSIDVMTQVESTQSQGHVVKGYKLQVSIFNTPEYVSYGACH